MTLLQQVIKSLEDTGRCTVVPFNVIAYSANELQQRSEFDYDTNLIGFMLGQWAKRSVDESCNNISFIKSDGKLIVWKNF